MSEMERVDVLVYRPGAMHPEPRTIEVPPIENCHYRDLNAAIAPLIGAGNNIEHVSVMFRDFRADMFVDEFSAINPRLVFGDKDLPDVGPQPVNEAATLIYHEASRQRGQDMSGAPKIHGVAVIALKKLWR